MSSRAKKSFAWIWMFALLTATFGISVQQIYCYCMGETTISFFAAEDPCIAGEQVGKSDCCPKPSPRPTHSCCEKGGGLASKEHDGCMEKSTKVFQLKTEFVVDKPLEKTFDCPLWMQEMPLFKRSLRPAICEVVFLNKPPPPSLSGRDICLRHQLFRC